MKKPLDVIAGLALRFTSIRQRVNWVHPARVAGNASAPKRHSDYRYLPVALSIIALSACSSPAVRVQYIETKTYIPIPAELTQPISVDLTGATWGSAVADLKAGLQTCDGQLQAIKDLKVPPKTP